MTDDRIVVGFDGSDGARAALRWALQVAGTEGMRLEAVAALTLPTGAASPWGPVVAVDEGEYEAAYERDLQASVADVRTGVPGAPEVELRVVSGVGGPALLRAATGAHLLVVGRRGHGGFAGLLLGSVADYCLHHAAVPLALVPPDGVDATGPVVVGIDGSAHAADALRWGAAEADRLGKGIVALYAWCWLDQPGRFDVDFDDEAARRYAEGVAREALGGREVEVVVVNDLPASALVERSAKGDLVVVGSRGEGAVRQAILGSVSRQLAHHAPAPVVVIRPR